MRLLLFSFSLLTLVGCGGAPAKYDPANFRTALEGMVQGAEYNNAIDYLQSADAKRQADHDKTGYLAIGRGADLFLPGSNVDAEYDATRDWKFPLAPESVDDMGWQEAATQFAETYNNHRSLNESPHNAN
ncbi:MAG: hypothetical protein R3C01_06985 [Planctomycetaceae bacterium]